MLADTQMAETAKPLTVTDKNGKTRQYTPRSYDKLVGVDPQVILDRVAKGDLLREIAADYGCVVQTVSEYVKRHVDRDVWMQVREHSIAARIEKSVQDIEQAQDQLELSRAREAARLWMWRAEREFPHLYATKPTTAVQVNGGDGGMSVQIVSYASNNALQHEPDDGSEDAEST